MSLKKPLAILCWLMAQGSFAEAADPKDEEVLDLNIEELVNIKVTSVSKKVQSLSDAPAAIFVISHEDIKRSGVTSIPEALRMAPGIDVARINSNKWAISARGFNGSVANKLLVLVDGRSVYDPTFAGVNWDVQDTLLEDVERIEVIRGSGATLWGANAVNGVINIITKHTEDTQGGLLTAGGGDKETGFGALRYGKKLGDETYARAYVKGFQRDAFKTPNGFEGNDAWDKQQGGFRLDSRLTDQDELTVQGDLYQGKINKAEILPTVAPPYYLPTNNSYQISGWNINSIWQHNYSLTSASKLQFYYDHRRRDEYILQDIDTLDVDFQHNFKWGERQNVIWGLNYRYNHDYLGQTANVSITPRNRGVQLISGFVQDEIMLIDNSLWFTVGSKFEHNDFTGFEGQPSAKLMWSPAVNHKVWVSFSRSVRVPTRADQGLSIYELTIPPSPASMNLPIAVMLNGNPNFQSEVLLAYELGYRFTINHEASLDITAFYNDYNKLLNVQEAGVALIGDNPTNSYLQKLLTFGNGQGAHNYGIETTAIWQMSDWWRWDLNYSFLKTDLVQADNSAVSPQHKVSLRAALNPIKDITFDAWLRYTGNALALNPRGFSAYPINQYLTLDMRLAWKPHEAVEFSVVGQNLLDDYHLEYIDQVYTMPTEIARGVYGKVTWQF